MLRRDHDGRSPRTDSKRSLTGRGRAGDRGLSARGPGDLRVCDAERDDGVDRGEETLEEWLTSYSPLGGKYQFKSTDLDKSAVHASLRLLVNLSFYLDAQSAEGKKLPKREILQRKWRKGRDPGPAIPPAWQLGQDVKLSTELRAAAKHSASPNPKTRAEWELKSQHVVRGHWRNQAHGPDRTLRKRIWIAPHWRGPQAGEAIVRNFSDTGGDGGNR